MGSLGAKGGVSVGCLPWFKNKISKDKKFKKKKKSI